MAIKRYPPSLTDETLQTPPKSMMEAGHPAEKQDTANVLLTVERNEGGCPYYLEGDQIMYRGMTADSLEHVCCSAYYETYPYIVGLSFGTSAVDLGIACEGSEDGFVCCGAWGCPTCESKVVFRLHPVPSEEHVIDSFYVHVAQENNHCCPEPMRKYGEERVEQRREELMEEYDKAGRPLFWDKWGEESELKQNLLKDREQGIAASYRIKTRLEK